MAATTKIDKLVQQTADQILEGRDLKEIRIELKHNGNSGDTVNKIVLRAKDEIRNRVEELKDVLPDLNLYRLNQLYTTSINAPARDRAYIVREINSMLGIYKQEVDLNVGFSFVIDENDEVVPDER